MASVSIFTTRNEGELLPIRGGLAPFGGVWCGDRAQTLVPSGSNSDAAQRSLYT
jgi:hypothetical protein